MTYTAASAFPCLNANLMALDALATALNTKCVGPHHLRLLRGGGGGLGASLALVIFCCLGAPYILFFFAGCALEKFGMPGNRRYETDW